MKVLLATHLDHPHHPPVTALRYLVRELPDVAFSAFSLTSREGPQRVPASSDTARSIWCHTNLTRVTPLQALLRAYDIIHMKTVSRAALRLAALHAAVPRQRARIVFTASVEPNPVDSTFELMRRAVRTADYVTAISEATGRGVIEHFGRHADAVTPNGVDASFFVPSQRGLAGVGRANTVGVVGFLSQRKRFDFILALARALPEVAFTVAGRAYTPDEQRRADEAMGSLPNVRSVGHVTKSELRDVLDQCRVLAFPSSREGSPSAVLEALAMGVPVLAQPVSSLPEYVRDGENGWLREASLAAWSDAIRSVMAMPDEAYAAMATRTRTQVLRQHTWRSAALRYRRAYEAVLARGRDRSRRAGP